jgi:hypothetical protein
MSEWTLGLVKARGMALEAYCPNKVCSLFYSFNLDRLIAQTGPEFRIADIPPLDCTQCQTRLDIRLAMTRSDDNVPEAT